MRLAGKVALVTGASQGIGAAIVTRFAEEGADVAINFRSKPEQAEALKQKVESTGRRAYVHQADVSKVAEVRALIDATVHYFGQIDVLINNAGMETKADFWDVTEEDYDKVLDANLKGTFFASQAFARHAMQSKQPGRIINISSVHEELPFPHFAAYCASKGGMKMLTRTLAVELAPYQITVNSIAPGAIATPINTALLNDSAKLNQLLTQIPLNRLGKPEDVASAAVYLASSDADYVTATTLFVDGGLLWNYHEQ